jgi:hypothetical protein
MRTSDKELPRSVGLEIGEDWSGLGGVAGVGAVVAAVDVVVVVLGCRDCP